MSFKNLGLSEPILKAVKLKGYKKPSVIQEKAIPVVLKGKDVLASAQTGTGKTAGFTLPILEILSRKNTKGTRYVRSLILTPTRELAAQIGENIIDYSKFTSLKSSVIFGGVKQHSQVKALQGGIDILVATPGRLLDLCNQKLLDLSRVELFVLDEADRMLDMGFIRDIERIMALVPNKRQTLLFSATFSKEIKKLANKYLTNPVAVAAAPENATADKIKQKLFRVDKSKKTALIIKLINEGNWNQVLVFTRTKHGANRLCKKMNSNNISAAAIHGNKTQNARVKALASFKSAKVRVLVATDIAARGLDIPLLPYVINFELPNISEDYVHRIGRTGRAGANGIAMSLVSSDELDYVKGIEKLLGIQLEMTIVPGFEPSAETPENEKPKPKSKPRNRKFRQNKSRTTKNRVNRNSKTEQKSATPRNKKRRENKVLDKNFDRKKPKKPISDKNTSVNKYKTNNGNKEPMEW